MSVVEIRGIKKHFGDVRAVDGVDLSVRKGELLVLLGPSGCGKTTLLRMIAGLERPTGGDILIGGEVVTDLPPRARHIAMVFQSYALYPHMTVFDNIAFPLKARGIPKEERRAKVENAAGLLGIESLLHRKPRQLSGGQRQRVALARAMVRSPRVMLLDEPLSNLDAKQRASARDELQQFQRQMGITTIFVTHDQIEAMGLGDRIVVMHDGQMRQVGTPQEVYYDSADTFVATFLGSPGINLVNRADYILGFRPEHFLPKDVLSTDEEKCVSFTYDVTRIEYLGADRLLYGNLAGIASDVKTMSRLPTTVPVTAEAGQQYEFVVREQDLRFFDRTTGKRTAPREIGE